MTALIPADLDLDHVRRTYASVLGDPRLGYPNLGTEERWAHVAGLLRGQLRMLVCVVEGEVGGLQGENLETAEYILTRAQDALTMSFREAREPENVQDLASLTRSLLSVHEFPRAG